jgi:hypothetical protein
MVLVAILVAGLLQFFLPTCRLDISQWGRLYLQKMLQLMGESAQNRWVSVAFLCLPVWIVVLIVLALLNWLLGPVAYWIGVFFISWLCVDIYPSPKEQGPITMQWMVSKRDAVFSPVFWFALLKAPLLVLYSILRFMRDNWTQVEGSHPTENPCVDIIAVLSWVPARLMVLASAVVGDFFSTIKAASSFWLAPIKADDSQLWSCMQASLPHKAGENDQETTESCGVFAQYRATLLVWLVVIGIFSVGYWVAV